MSKEKPKAELKEICREKGIKVSGTKEELVERLQKLDQAILPKERDDRVFQLMDAADDQALLERMQGNVVDKYVYSFLQNGKEIMGLTAVGVDNACRVSADQKGIAYRVEGMPQVTEDEDHIRVTVKACRYAIERTENGETREQLLDSAYGSKRQWKKTKLRSGKVVPDPFYFEKAVHKAERNAKRALLPEPFILEMIKMYKNGGKVQTVKKQPTISEKQRRALIHKAGSKERLESIAKELGYDSTTEILAGSVAQVNEAIEAQQAQNKVPQVLQDDMEKLANLMGTKFPQAKIQAQWNALMEKHGTTAAALKEARKGISEKIKELERNEN